MRPLCAYARVHTYFSMCVRVCVGVYAYVLYLFLCVRVCAHVWALACAQMCVYVRVSYLYACNASVSQYYFI